MSEKLRYYSLSMSIIEIMRLIEDKQIEIDTNIYRNFIWSKKKQSLFIDSIYRNFPVPTIFLYEDEKSYGKYKVIDGIQRLRTIHAFFNNELKINLKGTLQYSTFFDLPNKERDRLLNSVISVTVVEDIWNDDKVVEEIFYRLNMGGTNLTSQEFRNRMYSGIMIDTINNLNNTQLWRGFYNKPINPRYKDSEEILKFFALVYNENIKRTPLNEQMDKFIQENRNNLILADRLADIFNTVLKIVYKEFGLDIFKNKTGIDQQIYMLLFIPLGILVSKGQDEFSFDKIRNILLNDNITKMPVYKLISIGLDVLEGDKND
ncbi:DUF262 domain-containing protein [Fictibacillus nanhaiensis]|uniref:DUF262 domain-containing protein n=1 Tax=Fictibacillus nanhaiensis TaxID=742169 RepID=UPI00203D5C8A|nr:DUF262 domain-containing protein [Fictibacillus nanhaiensis]MCM3733820.1 DUF262 domain-containing protein [Fictibacillus nanhaiensis]